MKQINFPKTIASKCSLIISIAAMAVNVHAQTITTVAGLGVMGYGGDGSPATAALLFYPTNTAEDASGNLYIADQNNNVVRKVNTAGIISTVAGTGSAGFTGDGGPATAAQMVFPFAVAVDASGNLFIADQINNRIRKVNTAGMISTIAGDGSTSYSGDGGPSSAAKISQPAGMVVDATGNLYFADQANNRIRKISTGGIITTVAGNGSAGYAGDGAAATAAKLQAPTAIAFDISGNMYIADDGNYAIRKVTAAGIISTVAGTTSAGYTGDGGPATAAKISSCYGIALDGGGNMYISAPNNNVIRKVSTTGIITTIAGTGTAGYSGDGGPASSATLQTSQGLMVDHSGMLFIADAGNNVVRKFKVASPSLQAEQTVLPHSSLLLTPNPSKGPFVVTGTLNSQGTQQASVVVSDISGNTVYHQNASVLNGKINIVIDLGAELPAGLYMLKVITNDESTTTKLLFER